VINHALFKSLLFMGAGAVYKSVHTREIDMMGGLIRKMPFTGASFLVGSAAISGLPPLNGFVSEFLIYAASFFGIIKQETSVTLTMVFAVASLALIGGLATACFAKAFGIIFLGNPRSLEHTGTGEVGKLMLVPMLSISALCCMIGLSASFVAWKAAVVAMSVFGLRIPAEFYSVSAMLFKLCLTLWIFSVLAGLFYLMRNFLLKKRMVGSEPTWDCGYTCGTGRMQYTGSSFAQPIIDFFAGVLKTEKKVRMPDRYFPEESAFSTDTPDVGNERIYRPVFSFVKSFLARFGVIQHGRIQLYVLYIVVALIVILFWRLQ